MEIHYAMSADKKLYPMIPYSSFYTTYYLSSVWNVRCGQKHPIFCLSLYTPYELKKMNVDSRNNV